MTAANTDKFIKSARRWAGSIGASGVADSTVTTVGLDSSTNLPTDTAVALVIDRVDSSSTLTPNKEEVIIGVVSGDNIINCVRGVEGSAQSHAAGAVVELKLFSAVWDRLISGLLVEHNQDGTHNISGMVTLTGTQELSNKTHDGDFGLKNTTDNIQVNSTDPYRTVDLAPGFLKPTTTNGCADSETTELATNDIDYDSINFDKDSDEYAFCNFAMPASWDGGVVQFRYYWTTDTGGASAETVKMYMEGRSFASGDAGDQANGTAVGVADTWEADKDFMISDWSGDVTLAGTPAGGEMIHLEIYRDVSEDNLAEDARIMTVQLRYKQAKYSD